MIRYKTDLFLLFISVIYSCKSNSSSKSSDTAISRVALKKDSIDNDFDEEGIPVKYDSVKVIDTLYITDRDGVEVKNKPDINSKTISEREMEDFESRNKPKPHLKYHFGHRLAVIEKKDGWLGVVERITRRTRENSQSWLSEGWEKVYIQEKSTGKISDVKLTPEDLMVIAPENEDDTKKVYLKGYVDLKLISKSEYDDKKATAINYLVEDTLNIKKKKGVIELPCESGIQRYADDTSSDNYTTYRYIGQISFLNKYLIFGAYDATESSDYSLIDKKTGAVFSQFTALPYISYNKKYIIGITSNIERETADLVLCGIDGTKIKLILNTSFNYWMPPDDDKAMFWGSDGCFYCPVAYSTISQEKGAYFQYLKISIL